MGYRGLTNIIKICEIIYALCKFTGGIIEMNVSNINYQAHIFKFLYYVDSNIKT